MCGCWFRMGACSKIIAEGPLKQPQQPGVNRQQLKRLDNQIESYICITLSIKAKNSKSKF